MAQYYDRYSGFRINGQTRTVPFISIDIKSSDKSIAYISGRDRMDILSQKYYGSPFYGFLIMSANPEFGGLEFLIPDRTIIRVPYPFRESLQQYVNKLARFDQLYGIF